jgi:hypothetical protein
VTKLSVTQRKQRKRIELSRDKAAWKTVIDKEVKRRGARSKQHTNTICYCCDGARQRLREPGPLTEPLSTPQMINEWIWSTDGMILTGKRRRTRRTIPQCHSVHHKSHTDWQKSEPGTPRWEPAINCTIIQIPYSELRLRLSASGEKCGIKHTSVIYWNKTANFLKTLSIHASNHQVIKKHLSQVVSKSANQPLSYLASQWVI